jgi:hypothetical protein
VLELNEQANEQAIEMDDRRYALRQKSKVETFLVEHAKLGCHEVRVLDISRNGLRLLMPLCIPCGDEIIIHPPKGTELMKLRANIVRQRLMLQGEERWFECGMQIADTAEWRKHKWFLTLMVFDAM